MPSCLPYSWTKCRLLSPILLALLLLAEMDIPRLSKATCENGTSSDRFGFTFLRNTSACGWTLNATDNNSMLTIHILFSNNFKDPMHIILPSGKHFTRNTGSPWLHGNPWCGVFIAKNQTNCRLNTSYSSSCKAVTEYSETWPPTISVNALDENVRILLLYSFVQCPASTPTTTGHMTTTQSLTSDHVTDVIQNKEPGSESVTTQLSTRILTEVTNPAGQESTKQATTGGLSNVLSDYQTSAAVISVLAVLLLFASVAVAVLAVKCRMLQQSAGSAQGCQQGQDTSTRIGVNEPASNLYSMADSEKEMVDNVLYGATELTGEKQTVYNELYAPTSAR